jgi:secreted PhoX family phosphatase
MTSTTGGGNASRDAHTMNTRREFLKRASVAGAAITWPLEGLWQRGAAVESDGYGSLRPARDEATGLHLIDLPDGFRYTSFGWTGDAMASGLRTPGAHDGMAAYATGDGLVALIRNHEIGPGRAFAPDLAYDPGAGGGTTTILFDPVSGRAVSSNASLSGTSRNCAGGPTPWRTWLTCEETTAGIGDELSLERDHGYVFEVSLDGTGSRQPLVDMGRFVHEAVAVDPESGTVYLTEDQRRAGWYRFIPRTPGKLADGGKLQMLGIAGRPRFDTRTGQTASARYGIRWIDIERPNTAHNDAARKDGAGVFTQGYEAGAAIFARLEGAWYSDGRVFVTATNGGNAQTGQVWELNIREQEIRLVFESPGAHVLNMPDNLAVSPRGGLVLCEDGTANPCVHGLTVDGRIVRFARNATVLQGERNGITGDFRASEFAGAVFSPDGKWLFVNLQAPGITLAITGPWERGIL